MTPLPSGSLAQIWPRLLRGKFITNQWLPCCLRSSIHRHFLAICRSSVHCRKLKMYWVGPLLLGQCLRRIWTRTCSTVTSFWKWSTQFEGWYERGWNWCLLLDLVITCTGKEKLCLQSPCCVATHKTLYSPEEKYLWVLVTKGQAVPAPPVFSSVSELSSREWLLPDYTVPYHVEEIGFTAGMHLKRCHSLGSTGQLA